MVAVLRKLFCLVLALMMVPSGAYGAAHVATQQSRPATSAHLQRPMAEMDQDESATTTLGKIKKGLEKLKNAAIVNAFKVKDFVLTNLSYDNVGAVCIALAAAYILKRKSDAPLADSTQQQDDPIVPSGSPKAGGKSPGGSKKSTPPLRQRPSHLNASITATVEPSADGSTGSLTVTACQIPVGNQTGVTCGFHAFKNCLAMFSQGDDRTRALQDVTVNSADHDYRKRAQQIRQVLNLAPVRSQDATKKHNLKERAVDFVVDTLFYQPGSIEGLLYLIKIGTGIDLLQQSEELRLFVERTMRQRFNALVNTPFDDWLQENNNSYAPNQEELFKQFAQQKLAETPERPDDPATVRGRERFKGNLAQYREIAANNFVVTNSNVKETIRHNLPDDITDLSADSPQHMCIITHGLADYAKKYKLTNYLDPKVFTGYRSEDAALDGNELNQLIEQVASDRSIHVLEISNQTVRADGGSGGGQGDLLLQNRKAAELYGTFGTIADTLRAPGTHGVIVHELQGWHWIAITIERDEENNTVRYTAMDSLGHNHLESPELEIVIRLVEGDAAADAYMRAAQNYFNGSPASA